MQYFRFRLVRLLYLEVKTVVSETALSIGPKRMNPHTLLKKHGNNANFPIGALFVVRQTTEKFHSLSSPKRHVHTSTKHCVISQLNLKVQKYRTLDKFLQV